MKFIYVYHAVTERPMMLGQRMVFDSERHNGVYRRIMTCKEIMDGKTATGSLADFIRSGISDWIPCTRRELALEKVRMAEFPDYPSRLSCLYCSRTLEEAVQWARFFKSVGRSVFSVVKLKVEGNCFEGDSCNCFDGTEDEAWNVKMARHYWNNDRYNERPIIEVLVDGELTVVEICEENFQ